MEFTGYAVRRLDNGLYWNKSSKTWQEFPTIYEQKRFATCAGTEHTRKDNRLAVKVRCTIEEIEE